MTDQEYSILCLTLQRLRKRRSHWNDKSHEALMQSNLLNAAGFQLRANGLDDAIAILDAAIDETTQ